MKKAVDKLLDDYIEACVALEPEGGDALRQKLAQGARKYRSSYARGYLALMNEIEPKRPDNTSKTIYGYLGLSDSDMQKCYEAAAALVESQKYQEAEDAFFFLVTLAPNCAEFWLDLAFCYSKRGRFEEAIDAYAKGIELEPDKADGYLACAGCYIRMEDFEQAAKTCDMGLSYAEKHRKERWAKEVIGLLEEGKKQIEELYIKSKYGTFAS